MTSTNTIGTKQEPMTLDQLSNVMLSRPAPHGFFVSKTLWDTIARRFAKESGDALAAIPDQFNGIKIAIDYSLADTQFDVAFTEDAWRKRLIEIGADVHG